MVDARSIGKLRLATFDEQVWQVFDERGQRTFVEAEIAARDASNAANRLRAAGFPATKTLDGFDLTASSIARQSFDYLASLEWIDARENALVVGPTGRG